MKLKRPLDTPPRYNLGPCSKEMVEKPHLKLKLVRRILIIKLPAQSANTMTQKSPVLCKSLRSEYKTNSRPTRSNQVRMASGNGLHIDGQLLLSMDKDWIMITNQMTR